MKIVIAGEIPFVGEVSQLCVDAGHDVQLYLVEDFGSAVESGLLMSRDRNIDVVIELHNESAPAKEKLLRGLATAIPEQSLVLVSALATSSTQAASWLPNPGRVVGFSLLPPVQAGDLIELAPALQTTERHMVRAISFWQSLGMEPIQVADGPGLVRARVICCLINEAVSALMEGVASVEDIDKAMKLGVNYPYGPLEWADYLGIDTVLGVMSGLFSEWGDDRYRPAPLLRRMVAAGYLGKKSGRGFYDYSAETGGEGS